MLLKGLKTAKVLKYIAKKLPFPDSKPFITKYDKPGGRKQLEADIGKISFDETKDFHMKDGVSYTCIALLHDKTANIHVQWKTRHVNTCFCHIKYVCSNLPVGWLCS